MDIKIPEERLVVEFDGCYWHSSSNDRDNRKTAKLHHSDWKVIRVRDHGLALVASSDVRVDTCKMSHKEIANRTLLKVYEVLGRDKTEVMDYLAQPGPAKQSQATAYIKGLKERKRQRDLGA